MRRVGTCQQRSVQTLRKWRRSGAAVHLSRQLLRLHQHHGKQFHPSQCKCASTWQHTEITATRGDVRGTAHPQVSLSSCTSWCIKLLDMRTGSCNVQPHTFQASQLLSTHLLRCRGWWGPGPQVPARYPPSRPPAAQSACRVVCCTARTPHTPRCAMSRPCARPTRPAVHTSWNKNRRQGTVDPGVG